MLGVERSDQPRGRKIPWESDAGVPFMWQPANPNFGLFCNAFTFIAVPFERYIADRRVSAQQLMSNSMLFGELRYRLPGGNRRRARRSGPPTLFHAVPTGQLVTMVFRLALSQTPHHDPADQPLPDWADTWMREYEQGSDRTAFYPTTER